MGEVKVGEYYRHNLTRASYKARGEDIIKIVSIDKNTYCYYFIDDATHIYQYEDKYIQKWLTHLPAYKCRDTKLWKAMHE